jgi:outer membrane immunogenic protein
MMMTSFIRVGLLAVATTALTLSAQAADMRAPVYKGPPPPSVVSAWTGCYVGGQVGAQWGEFTATVNYPSVPPVAASRNFEGDGTLIYGGQLGCNWQMANNFVLGVEADVVARSKGEFGGEVVRFVAPATDHFDAFGSFGTQSSVRLRIGTTFDRMLIYIAGGASWAKLSASHHLIRDGGPALVVDTGDRVSGWNIGIGGEFSVAPNWSMGLEYRYTDYGSHSFNVAAGTIGALTWIAHRGGIDDLRTQDIRLRVNYMFGMGPGPGPVRTRY